MIFFIYIIGVISTALCIDKYLGSKKEIYPEDYQNFVLLVALSWIELALFYYAYKKE